MSRSDKGGSSASNQIGLEMGSPPSAYGISPARGEKRSFVKFSSKREQNPEHAIERELDYMSNCDCRANGCGNRLAKRKTTQLTATQIAYRSSARS